MTYFATLSSMPRRSPAEWIGAPKTLANKPMLAVSCVILLVAATTMACVDMKDTRHQALWEAAAGLLLVAGLALLGYQLGRTF